MADIGQLQRALVNADKAGDAAAATALAAELRRAMSDQSAPAEPDPIRQQAEALADQIEQYQGKAGAGELFKNQFALGLFDKVSGLANALPYVLPGGKSFSEQYKVGALAQRIREERARAESGNFGTAAEIGGSIATGALAKAPAAASWIGRMGQTAKEAGLLGTYAGLGNSEQDTLGGMAGDAAISGLAGAAVGGALQGGLELAKPVVGAFTRTGRALADMTGDETGRAARKVTKALADDGLTPAKAAGRMGRADTALINIGDDNVLSLASTVGTDRGVGRRTIQKGIEAQQRAAPGKAVAAINDALGGADETFNRRLSDMVTTRGKRANQIYSKAFDLNFPKGHSMAFDSIQSRVPGEAVRNAMKIAQAEGRPFGQQLVAAIGDDGLVKFSRRPSLREWHYIQRGLRSAADSAYRQGVGEVGTAYKSLHKELLAAMDAANPTYKVARGSYATESQLMDALAKGRDLMRPANLNNLDAFADEFAALSKPEREMVQIGLARGLEDLVQSTPNEAGNVVKKIFGTPQKRAAIRAVFDSDSAFRRFEVKMNRLAKEIYTFKRLSPKTNSATSFNQAARQAESGIQDAADFALTAIQNRPAAAMMQGLRRLIGSMNGIDEKVGAEVAKILMEKDPGLVMKALSPSVSRNVARQAQDEIMRLAFERARALAIGSGAAVGSTVATAQ